MRVLVNGVGNIGTTLLQVIAAHRELLGVSAVYAHKARIQPWDQFQIERLEAMGVVLAGTAGQPSLGEVAESLDYLFDTGQPGRGLERRAVYEHAGLRGAVAQGSENGFGVDYVLGFGMDVSRERWVHVPSCNTHGALAVLRTISGDRLDDVIAADFVVARRSEDIGNHERLVAGNVVVRHRDAQMGTHHAVDADAVLRQLGHEIAIQSSDVNTPSQFLHLTRFSVRLREPVTVGQARERIEHGRYVATTRVFDSNKVFEIGRRFGLAGRLYAQAVFVDENLLVHGDTVVGWAMVPQEGNTVLSTLAAFLQRTQGASTAVERTEKLASALVMRHV